MSRNLNHPVLIRKRSYGLIFFGLLMVLSSLTASAQSSGICTQNVFVSPISLYGGMAASLALDAQDNLYIAENANNWGITPQGPLVSKVTPQGVKSIFVPQGILGDVTALAFDFQGNLYVADGNGLGAEQPPANNLVWKIDPQGNATPFISAINNPTGLAFDAAHNLYVASFGDSSVYKFSSTGTFLGVATSGLPDAPYGIAFDSSGNLFVAGFGYADGSHIYKVTPAGEQSVFVDHGGDAHSLVFDQKGNLYASYYNGLEILRIAPDGSFVTFPGGCSDNDAANGLAINQHGVLYTAVNGGRTTDYPAVVKLFGIVPEQFGICPLYDQTRSVKAGATFPIKLELCDGDGNNLSSPSILVRATAITKLSSFSGDPEASGKANPDNNFRFDSELGTSGGYILNLTTAGLSSGTYSLQFTTTGDPVTHSLNFGVK
jgi:hypothetical protein